MRWRAVICFAAIAGYARKTKRAKENAVDTKTEMQTGTGSFPFDDEALQKVLAHTFADIPEAVVVADVNRDIILVNDAALELFRYSREELIGHSTAMLYEDAQGYLEQGRKRFNESASGRHETYQACYQRKDCSVFVGETIGGRIPGPSPGTAMYLGIIRDMTARIAREHALRGLHEITSDPSLSFAERRSAILHLGCRHFGMPIGIVSRIDGPHYEILDVVDQTAALESGQVFDLPETYCCHVLAEDAPYAVDRTGDSDLCNHPCYRRFALESYIGAPLKIDGDTVGTLNFSSTSATGAFSQNDLDLIGMFTQWLNHEMLRERDLNALKDARDQLEQLATLDDLTGLGNRRLITQQFDRELERGRRYARALSVVLIDFDRFKRLNDTHGHAAGDRALKLFAELATNTLRGADAIGRWGGEEFIVLLPDTAGSSAMISVERLLDRIRNADFQVDGRPVSLTASAGITTTLCDESVETIVDRADTALYEAKTQGRDRAVRC